MGVCLGVIGRQQISLSLAMPKGDQSSEWLVRMRGLDLTVSNFRTDGGYLMLVCSVM